MRHGPSLLQMSNGPTLEIGYRLNSCVLTIWCGVTLSQVLEKAGIEWRGWHAFRCGLATNLQSLGV